MTCSECRALIHTYLYSWCNCVVHIYREWFKTRQVAQRREPVVNIKSSPVQPHCIPHLTHSTVDPREPQKMKLISLLFAANAVTAKSDVPTDRLRALKYKLLDVVTNGGWNGDSNLYERVNKKTSIVVAKSTTMYFSLKVERDCEFPAHWNWEEYQVRLKQIFRITKAILGLTR